MEKVTVTTWINAPCEDVWSAITEPAHLQKWYVVNCAWENPTLQDFASLGLLPQFYAVDCSWEIPHLQVGAAVKLHHAEGDTHLAIIESLDLFRQLTLRWEILVTDFRLLAEDGGSRLTITESGVEPYRYEGYQMSIENLKAYLEGQPIPF